MNTFARRYPSDLRWGLALGLLLGGLLGGILQTRPAQAQFERERAAREVPAERTINLFAQWAGDSPVDGLFLKLPPGWTLQKGVALHGGTRQAPLETRPSKPAENEYFVGLDKTLRGTATFVFRVRTGTPAPSVRWSLEPFSFRSEQRLHRLSRYQQGWRVSVAPATAAEGNQVLSFTEDASPLLLNRPQLPSLATRAPFTAEAWMKTTGLHEVVLSTWDGRADQPYPLELVVDASGRLRCYRGRPGRHESMATTRPVADGTWHHVAVTHDPEVGRTRLLVDGYAVDSLRGTVPLEPSRDVVALGGRVPPPRAAADEETPSEQNATAQPGGFTGQLDEVHLWPHARQPATVRRTMRQPRRATTPSNEAANTRRFDGGETGPALLNFEDRGWPPEMVTNAPEGVTRTRSDLRFYAPVADLRARPEQNAVTLSWAAPDRGRFVIERSAARNGPFHEVGRREARTGTDRYSFTDPDAPDEVVFYRIRQQFPGDAERVSGTLKVGRGSSNERQEAVTLVGNFPNPFSEETAIVYQVHRETHVRLAVWDLTGQRVATLVNKPQGSGYKEVTFQPNNLSSGTYFIRLRAGDRTHTRKMALVK